MRWPFIILALLAACSTPPAARAGGTGLITPEGVTGMFLNPTSGTPARGKLTLQYCLGTGEQAGNTGVSHTAMATYAVTDGLELGALGRVSVLAATDRSVTAAGPMARLRLHRDDRGWPELAIGGIDREGDGPLVRRTLFGAASKRLSHAEASMIRSVRAHAGVRQLWQDPQFKKEHVTIGYVGGECELPRNVFVVGEVSTQDRTAFKHRPAALGIQVRDPGGFGFSLAAVQSGEYDRFGPYIGIGVNFN